MKKISRYIILIVAIITLAALAPRFLLLEQTKDAIVDQLSSRLGTPISVERIRWVWLPFPHLTIYNTNIVHEYYRFAAPEMNIYPNWRIIFEQKPVLGRILLKHPQIYIKDKAFRPDTSTPLNLPELNVYFDEGILQVESGETYKEILPPDVYTIDEIDGVLKMAPQKADFNLQGTASFSRTISVQGNFDAQSRKYQFFMDFQNIRLHNSLPALLQEHVVPVDSNARVAGTVTGTGLHHIEANLHGTFPSFKVLHEGHEILLAPGFTDLTVLKSDQLFSLTINELEVKDPQINLSGTIERKVESAAPDSMPQGREKDPTWTLDLRGRDLNLSSIREKILTLWPDNKTAQTVCNVVLSGKASTAAYRFSGKSADFKDLAAMTIEADVRNADIHVPHAELDLNNANGPILIKNAVLTGHDLTAQLGNSFGRNGSLLLGLAKDDHAFTLDIDIDADLKDLPPVLKRLVHHDAFQRELAKFKSVSGRASGNLHLGDELHNINTQVQVDSMQFQTWYDPIPRTLFIDKGALHVGPKEVSWQGVKGRIGLQEIMDTSGHVSWQTGKPLLEIEKIVGRADGKTLYALLQETGKLPDKKIKQKLSALNGSFEVSRGTVKGPAGKPSAWEYQLDVAAHGLSFTTPLLPEPVTVRELSAEINHKKVNIRHAGVSFLDQPLDISGIIQHRELENWHGTVRFNGPLRERLANWLISKGWFGKLQPQVPCIMENLALGFQKNTITLAGIIRHGKNGNKLPMARIDLENNPDRLRIKELTFLAEGEKGTFSLDLMRTPVKNLTFTWQGFVNADTIAALFHYSPFIKGTFGGVFFQAAFSEDHPEQTRFKGLFRAENLLVKGKDSEKGHTVFNNILLSGTGSRLNIPSLSLRMGDQRVTGQGHLTAGEKDLQIDLDLTSPNVSKKELDNLLRDLAEIHRIFHGNATARNEKEPTSVKGMDFTGRIGFDFDSYTTDSKVKDFNQTAQPVLYTFHDMHGELELGPDKLTKTKIYSAKLCNLDFKGSWYSDEKREQTLELASEDGDTLLMEDILPCLGLKQDLLEGEFSLTADLKKESGKWNSGSIHIRSNKGRILRFMLLSKIFKVVNITDFFVTQVGTSGKKGFPFSRMDIDAHINDGDLIFDRAILYGEGLNLFLDGNVRLADYDTDLTLLVAPFKTVDKLVSKVPLIGEPIMSGYESLLTFPVAIRGPLPDPMITPLHPKAVGDALFNFVKETFKLPYNIMRPHDVPSENSPEPGKKE